jgi:membrane protein YqaA with SNARE-associated domain
MSVTDNTKNALTNPQSHVHWVRLLIAFAGLIGLSIALAALLNILKDRLNFDLYSYAWLTYLAVFITTLVANLTIIAPVPFAVVIVVTAAQHFNPALVALAAALGGTLGEMSGYYAGRLGRKIAIPENIFSRQKTVFYIEKYGFWAITILAFQPIIPFDIGGFVAGAGKMPLVKFIPALFLGKFPKFLILAYASLGLLDFLPTWLTRYLT